MTEELSLKTLLEIISYNTLVVALAFSLAGAILYQAEANVGQGLGLTSGVLVIISTFTHRLSSH